MSKDKRGTNPKSLDNLVKGRVKGIKRRTNNAEGGQYNTWRDILSAIGTLDLTEVQWTQLSGVGITKEWATSKGITAYRKLYAAFLAYLNAPESPALLRDIMEREEGKVPTPVELSGSDGGPIEVRGFDYGIATAEIAPRPSGDSEPPGEDQGGLRGTPGGQDVHGG